MDSRWIVDYKDSWWIVDFMDSCGLFNVKQFQKIAHYFHNDDTFIFKLSKKVKIISCTT